MIEQKFGPRRCRDTRKPLASQCPEAVFYRCKSCKGLFTATGGLAAEDKKILCCGEEAERLVPADAGVAREFLELSYQITGGYNDNAVKVSWKAKGQEYVPQWIYLKTFTGGYLKYLTREKRSPMVFALADTDAFCYCDEDPCLECVFRCKRGFMVYAYSEGTGLLEMPLDKMTAHWQTGGKEPES